MGPDGLTGERGDPWRPERDVCRLDGATWSPEERKAKSMGTGQAHCKRHAEPGLWERGLQGLGPQTESFRLTASGWPLTPAPGDMPASCSWPFFFCPFTLRAPVAPTERTRSGHDVWLGHEGGLADDTEASIPWSFLGPGHFL